MLKFFIELIKRDDNIFYSNSSKVIPNIIFHFKSRLLDDLVIPIEKIKYMFLLLENIKQNFLNIH